MLIPTVVDFFMAQIIADAKERIGEGRARRSLFQLRFLGWFKYFNFSSTGAGARGGLAREFIIHALGSCCRPASLYTWAVAYGSSTAGLKVTRNFVDYGLFISLFPTSSRARPAPGTIAAGRNAKLTPRASSTDSCSSRPDCSRWSSRTTARSSPMQRSVADPVRHPITTLVGVTPLRGRLRRLQRSDIARGSANFGSTSQNFRQPYLALSLSEFETVAHHLSTWLRDYLYIGLGGNRYGEAKTYRNLFLTMLLGGLWHGANWTYVVWGALHGCGLAIERRFFPSRHGDDVASQYGLGMRWFHRILLFQFVCFAWIFFRAPTFGRAFEMLAALGTWTWSSAYGAAILMVAAFGLPLFFIDSWIERARTEYPSFSAHGRRVALACGMLLVTAVVGAADTSAFIYFQF